MAEKTGTLRNSLDGGGSRHLRATLHEDGELTVYGHDLGSGVGAIWGGGFSEYEYGWTIEPKEVERLKSALDTDDVLAALSRRSRSREGFSLSDFLKKNGIEYEFWSHLDD